MTRKYIETVLADFQAGEWTLEEAINILAEELLGLKLTTAQEWAKHGVYNIAWPLAAMPSAPFAGRDRPVTATAAAYMMGKATSYDLRQAMESAARAIQPKAREPKETPRVDPATP